MIWFLLLTWCSKCSKSENTDLETNDVLVNSSSKTEIELMARNKRNLKGKRHHVTFRYQISTNQLCLYLTVIDFDTLTVSKCLQTMIVDEVRDQRTVRFGDRPVRLGRRFSKFYWSRSGPIQDLPIFVGPCPVWS